MPVKQGETLATGHTPTTDSLIQIQRAAESLTYRWSSSPQWRSQSSATPKMAAGGFHRAAHSSPQQPLPMMMIPPVPFKHKLRICLELFTVVLRAADSARSEHRNSKCFDRCPHGCASTAIFSRQLIPNPAKHFPRARISISAAQHKVSQTCLLRPVLILLLPLSLSRAHC